VNNNTLTSLEHRQIIDRGLEEEHEYLWFVSENTPGEEISLDVFLTEGTITATADTDIPLRDFLETVESWYPANGSSVETYTLHDGEWSETRPKEIMFEDDVEVFDFHFYDTFDYFSISWENHIEPENDSIDYEDIPDHEVSISLDYDNADMRPHPESLEPLRKVMPELLDQESEGQYQVIGDLIKYLSHSGRFEESYPALREFDDEIIQHYLET